MVLGTKIANQQHIKSSLTGLSRFKDSKNRKNNNKNGKEGKKQDSISCIKFTMIGKKKYMSIKSQNKSNLDKKKKTENKQKEESNNMKHNSKRVD